MTSKKKSSRRKSIKLPPLKFFCSGPGIGESIVIQLPSGGWGVIDCWDKCDTESCPTLDFLIARKVKRLLFYCQTHPHADHFAGAYKLLDHFAGKIRNIWRWPGHTPKDYERWIADAKSIARFDGDTQALRYAAAFDKLLKCFDKEQKHLKEKNYRRISAPHDNILKSRKYKYKVHALGPSSSTQDKAEKALAMVIKNKKRGSILEDVSGEVLNSMSVVLLLEYSKAKVLLLADAQDKDKPAPSGPFSLIKVAHHGSQNGVYANGLTASSKLHGETYAVVTPFTPSGLPRGDMVKKYEKAFKSVLNTATKPIINVPGAITSAGVATEHNWIAIEVYPSGKSRQVSV